jgi:hypothetical protein
MGRRVKFLIAFSAIAALTAWGAPALLAASTDTDDSISPANTPFTANLKSGTTATVSTTLSGITVTATCSTSPISGTTPLKGLSAFKVSPPTFTKCTDNFGGTDTVHTSGVGKLAFHDAPNDETAEVAGDKLSLKIPVAGATITSTAAPGCVVTLAPTAAVSMTAKYDDVSTATFKGAKVAFSDSSGCPGGAQTGTGTFSATYVSSPGFHDVS